MIDELKRKLSYAQSNVEKLGDDKDLFELWQKQVVTIQEQIKFLEQFRK